MTVFLAVGSGCSDSEVNDGSNQNTWTKAEAEKLGGKGDDTSDICEESGWYDDGECDAFCLRPDPDCGDGLEAPELLLVPAPIKKFQFAWDLVDHATEYRLLESVWASHVRFESDFEVIATFDADVDFYEMSAPLFVRASANYILQACSEKGCAESNPVSGRERINEAIGYLKADNADEADHLGYSVALSQDGKTLAVGAPGEDSSALGVNGDSSDNSARNTGAVYVFAEVGGEWDLQAYLKAPDSAGGIGQTVTLSADGNVLAVGGDLEYLNGGERYGAVHVYKRTSGQWSFHDTLQPTVSNRNVRFGSSVSLAGDGKTLAIGSHGESGGKSALLEEGQDDISLLWSGAVYIFRDAGGKWEEESFLKASDASRNSRFGSSVALSRDASTLVVGAYGDGDEERATNMFPRGAPGAAYVFAQENGGWVEAAKLKNSDSEAGDKFGTRVNVSASGDVIAVSASGNHGVDVSERDWSGGSVYVFSRTSSETWTEEAQVEHYTGSWNYTTVWASSISMSDDGSRILIGGMLEDGIVTGLGGDQVDWRNAKRSGGTWLYERRGEEWVEASYMKPTNTHEDQRFGNAVAISGDGNTVAVGSFRESGWQVADDDYHSPVSSGAVYLY